MHQLIKPRTMSITVQRIQQPSCISSNKQLTHALEASGPLGVCRLETTAAVRQQKQVPDVKRQQTVTRHRQVPPNKELPSKNLSVSARVVKKTVAVGWRIEFGGSHGRRCWSFSCFLDCELPRLVFLAVVAAPNRKL